jgi:TolA-binding protein
VLVLDSEGKERVRLEGYLPRKEFQAWLEMGLGRVAFMHKRWEDAGQRYARVIENYADTTSAPEAIYWKAVSNYKRTNDHTVLGDVPKQLQEKYPTSVWALKAIPWAH